MFFSKYKKDIRRLKTALEEVEGKVARLEKENSGIQAALSGMVEGVIAVDRDTKIISLNHAVETMFNIRKEEAQGRLFLEAIRNNDIAEVINTVLQKKEAFSKELALVWPVRKIFQVSASPIFEDSRINGCIVVLHDITEIRKLEQVRRDFIANASHELKTPLTSIKGFIETLLEGALEDKENSRHFLQIIRDHANRLDALVNDLLKISGLESHAVPLEKEKTGLRILVDDILSGFKSQLKKKGIASVNDLSPDLSPFVDRNKIEQVFTNLIDNAIKFNRQGGGLKIYAQDSGKDVKVAVEDSGIGIPAKDIPRIFERFYRVDKARSRELGGTGLGLSIVKHIVELHGGSVGVESTEGFGSKFYFTLPK